MSYVPNKIDNEFHSIGDSNKIEAVHCIASHHTSKKELCSAALVGSSVSLVPTKMLEIPAALNLH